MEASTAVAGDTALPFLASSLKPRCEALIIWRLLKGKCGRHDNDIRSAPLTPVVLGQAIRKTLFIPRAPCRGGNGGVQTQELPGIEGNKCSGSSGIDHCMI